MRPDENVATDVQGVLSPAVGLIPAEALPQVWPIVLDILYTKGAKWLEVVDENDIYHAIANGKAELWAATHNAEIEGIMICMAERHARASYYHVCFLAGKNLKKYFAIGLNKLEQFASIMGFTEVVLEGRKGFARLLKPYGYHTNTVRLRKPVGVLWRN